MSDGEEHLVLSCSSSQLQGCELGDGEDPAEDHRVHLVVVDHQPDGVASPGDRLLRFAEVLHLLGQFGLTLSLVGHHLLHRVEADDGQPMPEILFFHASSSSKVTVVVNLSPDAVMIVKDSTCPSSSRFSFTSATITGKLLLNLTMAL